MLDILLGWISWPRIFGAQTQWARICTEKSWRGFQTVFKISFIYFKNILKHSRRKNSIFLQLFSVQILAHCVWALNILGQDIHTVLNSTDLQRIDREEGSYRWQETLNIDWSRVQTIARKTNEFAKVALILSATNEVNSGL